MAIIRVKTDYSTIQAAVNAAFAGDIILVEDGVYNEQVTVNKNFIKIIGIGDHVALDGQMKLNAGFVLDNVNGVLIKGFEVKNYRTDGIQIAGSSRYNAIEKARISNVDYYGIWLASSSSDNKVTETKITGCYYGIYNYSNNFILERSIISYNGAVGVYISDGSNIVVRGCIISNNISIGLTLFSNRATVVENKADENGSYGIYAYINCLLKANECCNNVSDGIYLSYYYNTVLENRTDYNGRYGIYVGGYNSVIRNTVNENTNIGIYIGSVGNTVLGNKAFKNGRYDIVRARADNFVKDNLCKTSLPQNICEKCVCDDKKDGEDDKADFINGEENRWIQ